MHNASKTDIEESYRIGVNAVNASENHTGIMMCFKRLSNHPYLIETEYKNVVDIANKEQRIPIEWINKKHNDITPELYDYLYPLIQGEVNVTYKFGLPLYIIFSNLN